MFKRVIAYSAFTLLLYCVLTFFRIDFFNYGYIGSVARDTGFTISRGSLVICIDKMGQGSNERFSRLVGYGIINVPITKPDELPEMGEWSYSPFYYERLQFPILWPTYYSNGGVIITIPILGVLMVLNGLFVLRSLVYRRMGN